MPISTRIKAILYEAWQGPVIKLLALGCSLFVLASIYLRMGLSKLGYAIWLLAVLLIAVGSLWLTIGEPLWKGMRKVYERVTARRGANRG